MTHKETLTVTDDRTGKTYEIPITDGAIRATDLKQINGLISYDPGLFNTAVTRSSVTYLDGEAGVLEYRGYPIEELAANSSFLEVAYLLIYGNLPSPTELTQWTNEITMHTFVHENIKSFMQGFRYDAHPMGMLLASVGALSTLYPDAGSRDPEVADRQGADADRVRVPAQSRAAVRLSRQRAQLRG
jgi:citrate synthase